MKTLVVCLMVVGAIILAVIDSPGWYAFWFAQFYMGYLQNDL